MNKRIRALEQNLAGRLMRFQERLYLILDVDSDSGFVRLSCRRNGIQQIVKFTIPEVLWWLAQEVENEDMAADL